MSYYQGIMRIVFDFILVEYKYRRDFRKFGELMVELRNEIIDIKQGLYCH